MVLKGILEDGLYKLQIPYQQTPRWLLTSLNKNNKAIQAYFVNSSSNLVPSCIFPQHACTLSVVLDFSNPSVNVTNASSVVNTASSSSTSYVVDTGLSSKYCTKLQTLHQRLGHASSIVIKNVVSIYKPKLSINKNFVFCDACQCGKAHQGSFYVSESRTTAPLELVHTDIWGPDTYCF